MIIIITKKKQDESLIKNNHHLIKEEKEHDALNCNQFECVRHCSDIFLKLFKVSLKTSTSSNLSL